MAKMDTARKSNSTGLRAKSQERRIQVLKTEKEHATGLHVKTVYLFHESKKIAVATKENMQSHFNVISTFINKRTNFATNKRP